MKSLYEIISERRDTRHFTNETVPKQVLEKALNAGHKAPSVGLTDATRYFIIESSEIKKQIKDLFTSYHKKSAKLTDSASQKKSYLALKLEAIEEAPIGLIIAYDRSVLDKFTIGTVGSNEAVKFSSVCAAQNIWLSLTEQGYSMGWVSIINYHHFKKLLQLPDNIEPLGYFCIGKPSTNYGKQPMLQQLNWKQKLDKPIVNKIENFTPINELKLENFAVSNSITSKLNEKLLNKINQKTKPLGALGVLEQLALQIGMVFQTETPKIKLPTIVVFAADHGIANHGVSAYPQEVTRQMVENFLKGGTAISVFCKQNNIDLKIVDAGVNYDFPTNTSIVNKKIAKGTQSFLTTSAMSLAEMNLCFQNGAEVINQIFQNGSNCVGFGEMGIGNTATASVLMSVLTKIPIQKCVGKGTGVTDEKLKNKTVILSNAISNFDDDATWENLVSHFGGFEILQMAGGMLQAYQNKMLILVDGFISTVAFLVAYQKNSAIKQNAIFCHCSEEKAHIDLLNYLKAAPVLSLKMRLGEGSGCAVAFPIIESALSFLNKMSTFESAGVSNK